MLALSALTAADLTAAFDQVHPRAQSPAHRGRIADRIAYLGSVDPQLFAVELWDHQGWRWGRGDRGASVALMSAMKPFLLLYLLETLGSAAVAQWVDDRPSDLPFNSLAQLQADGGRPRNPMINSGAITLADKLPGATGADRCHQFCHWLNTTAGTNYHLNQALLDSVHQGGREPNLALLDALTQAGVVDRADGSIDAYEHLCCLSSTVGDLARLGLLLALPPDRLRSLHALQVNQTLRTCGLYEASPCFNLRIGLPMKSGISGALVAVVPGQGAIACYSPLLDLQGNSVAGLAFLEALAQPLAQPSAQSSAQSSA
ncbi:glutaminase [Prochlorothrix hollandica]|uniref:glutaminase n=1 Tax=Prochlorothrix hollandica TaxID=1223 RepID=UPI00034512BA|nr:glutaminase [Prochlorothrix hollandica]